MRGWAQSPPMLWCLGLVIAVGAFTVNCIPASAAETHAFDPALSLTGDCSTSAADTVPDPGCPGPPQPSAPFFVARGTAIDSYGDIYVANYGSEASKGSEGVIDVFNAEGVFLTEIVDPNGPRDLAVDSEGNLYVYEYVNHSELGVPETNRIVRYSPTTSYAPEAGQIAYEATATLVAEGQPGQSIGGLAVDPRTNDLYMNQELHIAEYGPASENNPLIDGTIAAGEVGGRGIGMAVDAAHGLLYASNADNHVVKAFELESPHALVRTFKGSATPLGQEFGGSLISVAVDEGNGDVFIFDGGGTNAVYEFTEGGSYVSTIKHGFQDIFGQQIAVDNGAQSPNGALDPLGRYLFVPSGLGRPGHLFAFSPLAPNEAPSVEALSFANVTESEAELRAVVDPGHVASEYSFQYTTKTSYEAEAFAHAQIAGGGQLAASSIGVPVSAAASGLTPGAAYVFRVVATNAVGSAEGTEEFATYASQAFGPCPNAELRAGFSALLPDCRAYELVTPPDTNARSPLGVGHLGSYFETRQASPQGDAVSFEIEGGVLPGVEATGSFAGDPYLSTRGPAGWGSSYVGPSPVEAPQLLPGSSSPDQGYSLWEATGSEGSASIGGGKTSYVRYPDGRSALVGRGSLGTDPRAVARLISEGGSHIIFESGIEPGAPAVRLTADAPPAGTAAIYDRTTDEVTHLISLLPGDITPAAGEEAKYLGASADGSAVAFEVAEAGHFGESPLYVRLDDTETLQAAGPGATFAGLSEEGRYAFYTQGGDFYRYDAVGRSGVRITQTGDATVVNVPSQGTSAYFVSPSVISGAGQNPRGAKAQAGKENLYRWSGSGTRFVGTVTERDVEGEFRAGTDASFDGLGLWTEAMLGQFAKDPSRTTADGTVLLFESRADLAGYDPEGHAEVYRYDSSVETLQCISCLPTMAPATGQAGLQSVTIEQGAPEPLGPFAIVDNLSTDGRRAFFQTTEALVPSDTDELQDVYEWEEQGEGSCARVGGCIYLISGGHSSHVNYLFAASDSGNDVFFTSGDLLLPADAEATPSIYDARVGGGFPETPRREGCEGAACRPNLTPPPALTSPARPATGANDDLASHKRCPKGKRRVSSHGKARCLKEHRKRHRGQVRHHHKRRHGNGKGTGK